MRAKGIVAIIALVVAQAIGAAIATAQDAKKPTIRFGIQPGITTGSLVKHFRWLEDEGYKVEWISFNDAGSEMRALAAGALDLMLSGAAPQMVLSTRFPGSRFIAATIGNGNQLIVPVDSPIRTLSDLRGKRIAYPGPGSQQYALIATALLGVGMAPKEVNLYRSNAPDMPALLAKREVDGFMAWTPFTSESVRAGVGRVFLNAQDVFQKAGGKGIWISEGYVTTEKFATEHPDALVDCLKAIARSVRLLRSDQAKASAALSAATGMPAEAISYAIDHKFAVFPSSIAPDVDTVRSMVEIFGKAGLIKDVDIPSFVRTFVSPEFARRAEAQLQSSGK